MKSSISKNISYKEATHSNTATQKGIDNTPNEEQLYNMKLVANELFQPLREWYNKPIRINSFLRVPELNEAVGGSRNSAHTRGQAIDIDTDQDNALLFKYIRENLEFDKIIYEFGDGENPAWVHISYVEGKNRGIVLRAMKVNGRTEYVTL